MDKHGQFIYFTKARRVRKEVNGKTFLDFTGDTSMSPKVYAEQFIPKDHKNIGNQIAEYLWISKAMKMLYFVGGSNDDFNYKKSSLAGAQPGSVT